MARSFIPILCAALVVPDLSAAQQTGVWYGGFDLDLTEPGFSISVDVVQMRDFRSGPADLTIFVDGAIRSCPQSMQRRFCDALRHSAEGSFVTTEFSGMRIEPDPALPGTENVYIAFRLPGDQQDRVLRLSNQLTYYDAAIYSPGSGLDYSGFATRRPHLCEQTRCASDVFNDAAARPGRYLGSLRDLSWVDTLISGQSHGAANPQHPSDFGQGADQESRDGRSLLTDEWGIFEPTGEPLGQVRLVSGRDGTLQLTGNLIGVFTNGDPAETQFRRATQTDQAVSFWVTAHANGSGERLEGYLMMELPATASGYPRGTLVLGDMVMPVDILPSSVATPDDPPYDSPAIGIYKYNYALRGVPAGRSVQLRNSATRDAGVTGQIAASTRGITIRQCSADIDSLAFEQASLAGQKRMLDSVWCLIDGPGGARGWIPGLYLDPIPSSHGQ